jgi:hypothetical protein
MLVVQFNAEKSQRNLEILLEDTSRNTDLLLIQEPRAEGLDRQYFISHPSWEE